WMPAACNDQPYTCDWGTGRIYRHPLVCRGAGYEATQDSFLEINRSTDLDVDAIGNIYAASWRNGGFKWSGPDVGFIAKLRPEGLAEIALPDAERASVADLVTVLAGPSHRLRLEAQRAILQRSLAAEAQPALVALARDASARSAARVAALFTVALGRGEAAVPALTALAADASVAPWAIRALGDLAAAGTKVPQETLRAAACAADARTRKEAIVALVHAGDADAARTLLPRTADGDPVVAHTAVEGLVRLASTREADVITACIAAVDGADTDAAVRHAACRVLGEIHSEAAVDAVLPRLAVADASRTDLAWAAARQWRRESRWQGDGWGTRPDTRGPYYALEEWSASPRIATALGESIAAAAAAELPALARVVGLHRLPEATMLSGLASRGGDPAVAAAITAYFKLAGGKPSPAAAALMAAKPVPTVAPVEPSLAGPLAADGGPTLAGRGVDELLALAESERGDLGLGAHVFVAKKCVACHAAGPDSAGFGPSLANAAGIYPRRQLAESILLPHKSIAQGFKTNVIVLDDGRSVVGFVTREAAEIVVLRDAQGAEHRLQRAAIDERSELPTSVMPEGLVADLSVRQFASLLDYLQSLKLQ
ncbi:MAG: c-type cytochrome, partial [Planctomycetes bacterium]|nr:c-type cytochrome [Planctomycetota bacterium]